MANHLAQSHAPGQLASEDLRLVLGQNGLAELVRDSVSSKGNHSAGSDASERLLALLTFSYASGVFDSAEIPHELDQEDLLRLLGTSLPLDSHAFRQFRRQNRSELHGCLSQVLRRARKPQGTDWSEWTMNRWTTESCDGFDEEAEERINRAVRADTFALDD